MTAKRSTPIARRLRQNANAPEVCAWQTLRTMRGRGYPVRRQYPIAGYIVDFAILKSRLVIEVDGSIHNEESVRARDELRERDLRNLGWDVLRVSTDVAMSPDHLLMAVSGKLGLD
jgi:very-short-patch-repair endonuclease